MSRSYMFAVCCVVVCGLSGAVALSAEESAGSVFGGAAGGKRMSVSGVVRRVYTERGKDGCRYATVNTRFSSFTAIIPADAALSKDLLVDAEVSMAGVVAPVYSPDGLVGDMQLKVDSPKDITILKSAPKDPFALPVLDLAGRNGFPEAVSLHRVRMRGLVTYCNSRRRFLFLCAESGKRLRATFFGTAPKVGDFIDIVGFPHRSNGIPMMDDAVFRVVESRPDDIPPPTPVAIPRLVAEPSAGSNFHGVSVTVEGRVRSVGMIGHETRIELEDGDSWLTVILPTDAGAVPDGVERRATIRATGMFGCTYDYRTFPGRIHIKNPAVMPFSAEDVVLVSRAPWWTLRRLAVVAGILSLTALTSFLWGLYQRRQATSRMAELMRTRYAQRRMKIEAEAVRRERLRLSYDLHDEIQQLLAGTMCRLKAGLNYGGRGNAEKAIEQIELARQSVTQTQVSLRRILWGLHEEAEGPSGFSALLRHTADRMPQWKGIVHIRTEGEEQKVSSTQSAALLMILQEAIGNAISHGCASRIDVTVAFGDGNLELLVKDDGCGFDSSSKPDGGQHLGFASMQIRAERLGGSLSIDSKPGTGVSLRVRIPLLEENSRKDTE